MNELLINEKMIALGESRSVIREIFEYANRRKSEIGADKVFDFSIGNPSTPPPVGVQNALLDLLTNTDSMSLHSYTSSAGSLITRRRIAEKESARAGYPITADSVYMTCGAAASLSISLRALLREGDKVILLAPFFPEYKVFTENAGGVIVIVPPKDESMQPDMQAFEDALTEDVKAVIINSPNNPSGAIYSEETLSKMGKLLSDAEEKYQKSIYLISDEPYRELVYDGGSVPFAPAFYENTLVCYSYSKSLSLPGERIGYILVPPTVKAAEKVFAAVCGAGRSLGYVCAPSLFQHLVAACVDEVPDVATYDENRTLLYNSLSEMGFTCTKPEGAFYLFVKTPDGVSSQEFYEEAKKYELLLVPSDSFGIGGYVRVAYCIAKSTIEGALPAFQKLSEHYNLR